MNESKPETHKKICPFSIDRPLDTTIVNGGTLLSEPSFAHLTLARPLPNQSDVIAQGFGCLEFSDSKADKATHHNNSGIPTIKNMLDLAEANLNRIAQNDPKAPAFKVNLATEHEFKTHFAENALRVKDKIAPTLADSELARFVKGIYKVEDPDGTYDTQAGTPLKLAKSENPEANQAERRDLAKPASSGVGYLQIIMPTALHLMADNNEVATTLRANASQLPKDDKDSIRAAELDTKASLFETLQQRLRTEAVNFAPKINKRPNEYVDEQGIPTELLCKKLARSDKAIPSVGLTGKQFATAMQGLLLDGDIGPIIQAQQLGTNLEFALGKEAKEHFKNETLPWQTADKNFDKLAPEEKSKAITDYVSGLQDKLDDKQRALLAGKAAALTDGTAQDPPAKADEDTCDALFDAQARKKDHQTLPDVMKGVYCTPEILWKRSLAALGQLGNNWGLLQATKMLEHPTTQTSHILSREELRANRIARGVNADGLLDNISSRQNRPDDFGTREFSQIFEELAKEKNANRIGH